MTDRLIDYAVSVIKMEPEQRLDIIDLKAAEKSIQHLIQTSRDVLRQLQDPSFRREWRDQADARNERRRNKLEDVVERRNYLRTPEGRAELEAAKAKRRGIRNAKEHIEKTVRKSGKEALQKISDALHLAESVENLYETLRIGGKPIGDVHYRELYKLRTEGLFEAAMCEQIMRHARPNENLKIRDIVSVDKLKEFRNLAVAAVADAEREGIVPVVDDSATDRWSWRV